MVQAFLLSAAAGIASALLSGILTPNSMLAALLFFCAPLPLMIVGLGWHPLVSALGALIACILVSYGMGSKVALYYAGMVGLPSWLACEGLVRLMAYGSSSESARSLGLRIGVYLLGGIALYAVVIVLVGALAIDLSYDAFNRRLTDVVTTMFRTILEADRGRLPEGVNFGNLAKLYASVMPVALTFILCVMLAFSLFLAVKVVKKSERLPFVSPPLFLTALPKEALFVMIGCVALSRVPGWLGYVGGAGVAALSFCFILTGLAVMHAKTLGRSDRPILLAIAWVTMLVFGLPAFIFAFVGALDAAFDFRRLPDGTRNPPNPPSSR